MSGALMLQAFVGGKIIVRCDCGLSRRYDAWKMLERAGNVPMTDLLARMARANNCPRVAARAGVYDRCKMCYDLASMRATLPAKTEPE